MTAAEDRAGLSAQLRAAWGGGAEPRAGLSTAGIVGASVQLADADGVDGVTIRRLSTRLGCSAMAIYRHVASREELLLLTMDSALGEPERGGSGAGWEERLRQWAAGLFDRYLAHPWLLDLPLPGLPLTPRHAAWVEAMLDASAAIDLSVDERLEVGLLLDGHARNIANLARSRAAAGDARAAGELAEVMPADAYPRLRAVVAGGELQDTGTPSIGFGVDVILAGVRERVGG